MCFEEEKGTQEHYTHEYNTLSKFRMRGNELISNAVRLIERVNEVAKIWK